MGTLSQHDDITIQGDFAQEGIEIARPDESAILQRVPQEKDTIQRDGSTARKDESSGPGERDDVFVQWLEMYSNWDIFAVRNHL